MAVLASNVDFWFRNEHGFGIGLRAVSQDAKEWVEENIAPNDMVLGSIQYIEDRFAHIILRDLLEEGFEVRSPQGRLELVGEMDAATIPGIMANA
jgi:hypothetical protein